LNSSGELVVDTYGIPTGPLTGTKNEDPFWTTDIFRTPTTVRDLYSSGAGADIPVVSELPETSATYTIPLDHFASTTCYLFVGSDTQSIGPSSTIPLQMAHSTMVPHAMTIPTGNTVVTQDPIGTLLSSRPILSLPHGYNALNTYIPIPTQVSSGYSEIFTSPGYNATSSFILTSSQVPSEGSYLPFMGGFGPSGSNPIGGSNPSFASGFQILVGGQYNIGGKTQFGGHTQIGTPPLLGVQPLWRLYPTLWTKNSSIISPVLEPYHPWKSTIIWGETTSSYLLHTP
jgi:hypothetical protein